MNTKRQGMIGIGKAIEYYTKVGVSVFVPVSDCSRYDLVIDSDEGLKRVEVKTTVSKRGEFMLRTLGGNKSGSKAPKFLSSKDCDLVFLYDIRRDIYREFKICDLEGRSSIRLAVLPSSEGGGL